MEELKKIKSFLIKYKNPIIVLIVAIIMVIYFTPFKRLTKRYDTASKAFNAVESEKVNASVDFDNGSFIIYGDRVVLGDYVVKDDKGYVPPEKRYFKSSKTKNITNGQVTRFNDGKTSFIKVSITQTEQLDASKIKVPDGFKFYEIEREGRYYYFWMLCGNNMAENYCFSFDGQDIQI